ncbi:MAG: diguanylate cyclase [Myxococcota bacterium]
MTRQPDAGPFATSTLEEADTSGPVEIAPGVWWVGEYMPGDDFQCHVYLIDAGDESVLLDPGSVMTMEGTLRKIRQVMDLRRIRWIVAHHQDPDVVGALPHVERLIGRDDARVVTHWRARALLRHLDLRTPFWLVEDHEWRLEVPGRTLRFIFTPYMHFPGAFCTFDERSGILFSSDIFGGFTADWSLVARDESYFDAMRPFHEHYVPSREILNHGLRRIREYPVQLVAPQHGSLIPSRLLPYIMERLEGLECGLFLMSEGDTDVRRLMRINDLLRKMVQTLVLHRDFAPIAFDLQALAARLLPVAALDFLTVEEGEEESGQAHFMGPEQRYRPAPIETPPWLGRFVGLSRDDWGDQHRHHYTLFDYTPPHDSAPQETVPALAIPLFPAENRERNHACAVFRLTERVKPSPEVDSGIGDVAAPLSVAVERELILRRLERERQRVYERSIRDSLTGLHNRQYMASQVPRFLELQDRDPSLGVAAVILDIDHFKSVNDTFGHGVGDEVLARVARAVQDSARGSDVAVRLGGEEFALFLLGAERDRAADVAERLRREVEALDFGELLEGRPITVSAGAAERRPGEDLDDLLRRADHALYRAKRGGRNRVESD